MYIGVDNIARKIKNAYVGVDGKARKIKAVYVGVNGIARLVWKLGGRLGKVKNYLSVKKTTGCVANTEYGSVTSYSHSVSEYTGVSSKNPKVVYANSMTYIYNFYGETTNRHGFDRFVFDDSDNLVQVDSYNYGTNYYGSGGTVTHTYGINSTFEFGDCMFMSISDHAYDNSTSSSTTTVRNILHNYDTKTTVFSTTNGQDLAKGVAFNDNIAVATNKRGGYGCFLKRNGDSVSYSTIWFTDANGRNLDGDYGQYGLNVVKLSENKGLFMGRAYSSAGGGLGLYAYAFKINDDGNYITLGKLTHLPESTSYICNSMSSSKLYDIDENHAVFIAYYGNSDSNYYKNTYVPVMIDDNLNVTFGTFYQESVGSYGAFYYHRIGNGKTFGVAVSNTSSTNLTNNYGIHMYDLNTDTNTIVDRGIVYPNVNNTGASGSFPEMMPLGDNKIVCFDAYSERNIGGAYTHQTTLTPIIGEFNFE